jgi:hypothetical protein
MADKQLETIVQRMIDAGEPEANIAAVIREYKPASTTAAAEPKSPLERLAAWMPTVGGAVGGMAGGIPGAAMGGAAGRGYGELVKADLPGAVADVARNAVTQPRATAQGAFEGTMEALRPTATEGALQALTELAGRGATSLLSQGGRAVYRGFLKPSLSDRLLPKAKEIVETGIRESIPVTEAGAARVEKLTGELSAEVDRVLTAAKGDVNLSDVADQVRAFAKRKYFMPGKPTADYEAAMKVADELDQHPSLANPMAPNSPAMATPTAANRIKRGLDETIGESNFGVERGATKTAQKVARSTVRKSLETIAPEVGPLNAREGRLLDLGDALNRAVGREANRNQLFGVPSMMSGAAGATELLAGNRFAAAAMTMATRMGLTPAVATRGAIYAAKLGDALPGTAVADVARMAMQLASEQQPDK